jgi:8-oxo-dGTP pyrophosphatase MutT (NUDIX family)
MMMVRRKDSMAYTEFLRGKYEPAEPGYIRTLLSNMTKSEHGLLLTFTFNDLWTRHWGVGRDHHSKEFINSREKFDSLDITTLLKDINGYDEPEWGFPKGRRNNRETDIDCALREFSEETNILRESFVICRNIVLSESFNGTNGVPYKHIYFIALLREPESIDLQQVMTSAQKREISAIEWKTVEECREHTRPHYIQRNTMLDSFERIVETFDLQDNLPFKQGWQL